jgi:hypothetical protein
LSSPFGVNVLASGIFLDYWGHLSGSKNFYVIHKTQRCVVSVVTLEGATGNAGATAV